MSQARPFDHLKRHVPTNVALLATVVSSAMPILSVTFLTVPHGYTAARSHPLYWLLMAPLAVWVWGAISFDGWAVRLIAPLMVAAPVAAALLAMLTRPTGADRVVVWALAATAVLASTAGGIALARSPLWPFRREPT